MKLLKILSTATHVLFTSVIILFILTGFGITNYQIVEPLTFGMLGKPTSFLLHSNLVIPLLVLLLLHLVFVLRNKLQKKPFKL